jgi:uncharacterized protein
MHDNREPNGAMPDMPVVTDPDAVTRLAQERGDENIRFRLWVKTECRLPTSDLEALVASTADAVWRHIDCIRCSRCCQELWIPLNREDISRLAARLGMRASEFENQYVGVSDGERGMDGPCSFLQEGVCTVYPDRPKACRSYPFLHVPGFRHRMLSLLAGAEMCPVIYNTLEALKLRLGWKG